MELGLSEFIESGTINLEMFKGIFVLIPVIDNELLTISEEML